MQINTTTNIPWRRSLIGSLDSLPVYEALITVHLTVMLLLAFVCGINNWEETKCPSGDVIVSENLIPLLSAYNDPVEYPSTIQLRCVPFPEQLNVNVDILFSNVV